MKNGTFYVWATFVENWATFYFTPSGHTVCGQSKRLLRLVYNIWWVILRDKQKDDSNRHFDVTTNCQFLPKRDEEDQNCCCWQNVHLTRPPFRQTASPAAQLQNSLVLVATSLFGHRSTSSSKVVECFVFRSQVTSGPFTSASLRRTNLDQRRRRRRLQKQTSQKWQTKVQNDSAFAKWNLKI